MFPNVNLACEVLLELLDPPSAVQGWLEPVRGARHRRSRADPFPNVNTYESPASAPTLYERSHQTVEGATAPPSLLIQILDRASYSLMSTMLEGRGEIVFI